MKYANLLPDKQVSNYLWNHQAHLGSGAFGKVYLGYNQKTKEKVAIKIMENSQISDPYLQQALKNEVSILSQVKGPYVVGLLDFLQTKNRTYIIQMFCNMGDFRSYLTKQGKIQETQAKAIFIYFNNYEYSQKKILSDLLQGMQELAKHNLIHRDLKPENILVHDNIFKVADFGFGKNVSDMNAMLKTQCGTPLYMSPQILMGQQYTSKSDVWSMGIIYYEMLFGKTPWPCRSQNELVQNIQRIPIKFPYGEQISEESKSFLKKCLAVQEKDRYSWQQVFSDQIFKKQEHELHIQKKRSVDENDQNLIKQIQEAICKNNLQVDELFRKIDLTRTGSLDQKEMGRFIQIIVPGINQQYVEMLFNKIDVNKDGKISFEEFQDIFLQTDYSNQNENQMLNDYRANKIMKKLIDTINDNQIDISRIFKKFDKSGDNQLDMTEFAQILQVIDNTIIQQEIRFIFQKFDKDQSGKITLQEFDNEIKKVVQKPQAFVPTGTFKNLSQEAQYTLGILKNVIVNQQLNIQQIFSNFDRDRSGTLDYQEFALLTKTINERIPDVDIQQLFNAVDMGHNGAIVFDEFANMLK